MIFNPKGRRQLPAHAKGQTVKLVKIDGNPEVAKKVIEHEARFGKILGELKAFRAWLIGQISQADISADVRHAYSRALARFDDKEVPQAHVTPTEEAGDPETPA